MGGKNKQSQRTKNNVRPSSSGRSAELLSNALKGDSPFMPAAGGKIPALFPTLTVPGIDQNINPEYAICLKKLNKKDPITKTKALQELSELVSKSNGDDMVPALTTWAHFYRILSIDPDHKVREATQTCHGVVVSACRRRTAPVLRRVLGAWLAARADEYPPAAATAALSLTNTFPANKLPEVLAFCKTEVMAHLTDNALGNQDSMALNKLTTEEERKLYQTRLVTSGMQGLEFVVRQMPAAQHDWLWDQLSVILQDNTFWNRANHTNIHTRASWLALMGAIVQRYSEQYCVSHGARLARVLLSGNVTHAALWDTLLALMSHCSDWYDLLEKKEILSKKLFNLLENGGWGDAKQLSNMLLPILAHLPAQVLTQEFYETFFKSILVGLNTKSIINSKSERQALISGMAECLRYLSIQPRDFALEVVTSVHRDWLEMILSKAYDGPIRTNLIKHSATSMTSLVKYWLKQSKEDGTQKYDHLVRNFWQNLGSTVVSQIDKLTVDRERVTYIIDGHILLLQTLKVSFTQEVKKQQSIKFDDEHKETKVETALPTTPCDSDAALAFSHNLHDVTNKLCAHYFEFADKTQLSSCVISPLVTLLREFDSKTLFLRIASQCQSSSVYEWYDKVLRGWLSGDTMRCKELVDVVFLIMKHISEDEQTAMLESFKQFPPYVVEWCIQQSVSHTHCSNAAVRSWLASELVSSTVVSAVSRAVFGETGARNLVLMCLSQDDNGEMLIPCETVVVVAGRSAAELCSAPPPPHAAALCAELCAALCHTMPTHHLTHLALHMLRFLLHNDRESLGADTWRDVLCALQDVRRAEGGAEGAGGLLYAAADLARQRLLAQKDELNLPYIEHIVSICPYLLNDFSESQAPDDLAETIHFTKLLLDNHNETRVQIESHALRLDCIKNRLSCPIEDDSEVIAAVVLDSGERKNKDLTREDLLSHVTEYLFRALYLKTILVHKPCDDDEEAGEAWCSQLFNENYFVQEFCRLLYDYVVLRTLHRGYGFWHNHPIIEETKARLDLLLGEIIKETSSEHRSVIYDHLSKMAASEGYHWAYARAYYREQISEVGKQQHDFDFDNLDQMLTGSGYFHSLQADTHTHTEAETERCYRAAYLLCLRAVYSCRDVTAPPPLCDALFLADCSQHAPAYNLLLFINLYYRHSNTLLQETDVSEASWSSVLLSSHTAAMLCAHVTSHGWEATEHEWDYTNIALVALLQSLQNSKLHWGSTKVCMLATAVLRLFATVQHFILSVPAECERRTPSAHVAHLPAEWQDVFLPSCISALHHIYTHVLENSTKSVTSNEVAFLAALAECADTAAAGAAVTWPPATTTPRPAAARGRAGDAGGSAAGDGEGAARSSRLCCKVLQQDSHLTYKLAAVRLLHALTKHLIKADVDKLGAMTEEPSGASGAGAASGAAAVLSLTLFDAALRQLHDDVSIALSDVKEGEDVCSLVPYSESHTAASACLHLAAVVYRLCTSAPSELAYHYTHIVKQQGYTSLLISVCVRLQPGSVLQHARTAVQLPALQHGAAPASHHSPATPTHRGHALHQLQALYQHYYTTHFIPDIEAAPLAEHTCRVSCSVLCAAVRVGRAGGAARDAGGAGGRVLHSLARSYISPALIREQYNNVLRHAHTLEDTEITVHWSTNELVAVFMVEERPIELTVQLAPTHPLAPPTLTCRPPDLQNTQWLVLYLSYQTGSVLTAVRMWRRGVSERVARAPQCYICYCRLEPRTGLLPSTVCHQCRNKFHTTCLRKWFSTSNKSNCPLCRGVF